MKTKKQKRIRAKVLFTDSDGVLWKERAPRTERAYLLRQSDIRALAEQFVRASAKFQKVPEPQGPPREYALGIAMYLLADAGMTPGKERAK